jgi:hypothetical protein
MLMGFSQVVDHHGVWVKHAFTHVTVDMCDVTGADPAENAGISPDIMVKSPLSLVLDQVINFVVIMS